MTEPITVFNLEVEEWHTYFVSEKQVLVHNNGDCGYKVKATFNTQGETFEDVNPTDRPDRVGGMVPMVSSPPNWDRYDMHAEVGAMLQAYDVGIRGGYGELIVEGDTVCTYCQTAVKAIAQAMGLDALTVVDESGTYNFAGDELLPVDQGGKRWIPDL